METKDKFGIDMLFETNPNGAEPFEMGFGNWEERIEKGMDGKSRWNDGDFDGSGVDMIIHDSSGKDARYNIFSVSKENYEEEDIETLCRRKLASKGFMQTNKDWRNIEFTGWAYFEEVSDEDDEWTLYARGGKHQEENNGCEGCALKASIEYKGDLKFNKETHHGQDNPDNIRGPDELEDGILGRWLGFKYVLYNKNTDQDPVMEWYIDFLDSDEKKIDSRGKPKNKWKKVGTKEDDGSGDGDECDNCPTEGVQITWGGPIATIRWDNVKKVHLKWVSLREIIPLQETRGRGRGEDRGGEKKEYSSDSEWTDDRELRPEDASNKPMVLLDVGDPSPTAKIENKVLKVTGGSPRVYYSGPWRDVEFSADIKAVDNIKESTLVARSNHEERPCGFGGYVLFVSLDDKKIYFKKEINHDMCNDTDTKGYSERLKEMELDEDDVEEGVEFNQKIRVTNTEDGKVKIEGFFNGEKKNEIIDSGQIECGDPANGIPRVRTPAFKGEGKWCFTRANRKNGSEPGKTHYKNVLIRAL